MPYKFPDNVPRPSKNWTDEEQKKCIKAANAVLSGGGTEQDAIFACIRAAGKTQHPGGKATVKAVADGEEWALDILGIPFGSPTDRDNQGEYFDATTQLHEDKYPLPPLVYLHGMTDGLRSKEETPEYLGHTVKRWVDSAGVWFRGILDKTAARAKQVWEAAQKGMAGASSGALTHMVRVAPNGHIREWPIGELTIFDIAKERTPVNRHAIAVPAMKAIYQRAGLPLPDDIKAESEAAQEAEKAASAATAKGTKAKQNSGETEMDEKQVKAMMADVLKEDQERRDKEAAEAAEAARVKALEEENKALKAKEVEKERLPSNKGPHILKYADTRRYENLDVGEHALLVGMLESGQFVRAGNQRATDAAIKALALKIESEAEKSDAAHQANFALKALKANYAIKTNEINRSTLTSYGDEWVGVAYSRDLWEKIRAGAWVLDRLMRNGRVVEIPEGFESAVIPYESTDPIWYNVAQAISTTTTETSTAFYRPNVTVRSSRVGTAQRAIDIAKMGCRVLYTGEMTEDSLIGFVAQARKQIVETGAEQFDHAILNGDTTTGATTNINDIAESGTRTSIEVFSIVNGMRKLALVTNTANSRSGAALTDIDYLETVKLLGTAGMNAREHSAVTLIPDAHVYWKSLEMATVKTRDVWPQATLEDGVLTRIWGFELKPSWMMQYDEMGTVLGAYALKANASGKIDTDTTTNNTKGAILAVRWDQWALAWKRRMTLETDRYIESDTNQIVAMARWGLAYRDTEASAITYNVTV